MTGIGDGTIATRRLSRRRLLDQAARLAGLALVASPLGVTGTPRANAATASDCTDGCSRQYVGGVEHDLVACDRLVENRHYDIKRSGSLLFGPTMPLLLATGACGWATVANRVAQYARCEAGCTVAPPPTGGGGVCNPPCPAGQECVGGRCVPRSVTCPPESPVACGGGCCISGAQCCPYGGSPICWPVDKACP